MARKDPARFPAMYWQTLQGIADTGKPVEFRCETLGQARNKQSEFNQFVNRCRDSLDSQWNHFAILASKHSVTTTRFERDGIWYISIFSRKAQFDDALIAAYGADYFQEKLDRSITEEQAREHEHSVRSQLERIDTRALVIGKAQIAEQMLEEAISRNQLDKPPSERVIPDEADTKPFDYRTIEVAPSQPAQSSKPRSQEEATAMGWIQDPDNPKYWLPPQRNDKDSSK